MLTNNNDRYKREKNSKLHERKFGFEIGRKEAILFESRKLTSEILFRCFLISLYFILANMPPFHREIQSQELWLYNYPNEPRYLPARLFYPLIICIPLFTIWLCYQRNEDDVDVIEGFLSLTLSFSVTLLLAEILKNIIGRPRPNFLATCFPDGNLPDDLMCNTGTFYDIQSRKSFPSGHAAITFSSMTFVSFYLSGKMKLFNSNIQNEGVKLIIFLLPFIFASVIALTAFCDYHHHWEDIFAGSLIGFLITWLCYHLYYPKITISKCDMCLKCF